MSVLRRPPPSPISAAPNTAPWAPNAAIAARTAMKQGLISADEGSENSAFAATTRRTEKTTSGLIAGSCPPVASRVTRRPAAAAVQPSSNGHPRSTTNLGRVSTCPNLFAESEGKSAEVPREFTDDTPINFGGNRPRLRAGPSRMRPELQRPYAWWKHASLSGVPPPHFAHIWREGPAPLKVASGLLPPTPLFGCQRPDWA